MKTRNKFKITFLFIIVLVALVSVVQVYAGEKGISKDIKKAGFSLKHIEIESDEGIINVVESGNPNGKILFLIHGSPGDWSAWKNIFLDSIIQQKYRILAIDRVGFGNTTIKAKSTLKEQSEVILSVFKQLNLSNILLVSHSYGGAVAEQLLIDNSEYLDYNIFIAPTLSPMLQQPKWYNKMGKTFSFMLGKSFKSSNKEMIGLSQSLKENEPLLQQIKTPTTFIHGKKDWLVPVETVDYFKKYTKGSVKYIIDEKESHFILWSNTKLMIDAILEH